MPFCKPSPALLPPSFSHQSRFDWPEGDVYSFVLGNTRRFNNLQVDGREQKKSCFPIENLFI
jgi:hypothetical protein